MGAKSAQRSAAASQPAPAPYPEAAPPPPPQAPAAAAGPDYDEIRKLAELKDQGILTEEEFAAKKAQILGL